MKKICRLARMLRKKILIRMKRSKMKMLRVMGREEFKIIVSPPTQVK
jgi:hypothetical protein